MILPDLPVGLARSVVELRAVSSEVELGARNAAKLGDAAEAQRARAARIHHPQRHPGPVQKHMRKAKALAASASEKIKEVERLRGQIRMKTVKDLRAIPSATGLSAAALAGLPPKLLMSKEDIEHDETLAQLAAPARGMPRDAKEAFSLIANGIVSVL